MGVSPFTFYPSVCSEQQRGGVKQHAVKSTGGREVEQRKHNELEGISF